MTHTNLTTAEVLHLMLEQCSKPSKQVADECGMNYSTFMRKVSPVDDAAHFTIEEMILYIKATGSELVLDHLNARVGRLYVPFPRGRRKGTNPKQDIHQYSSKFAKLCGKLLQHAATGEDVEEILELMDLHLGDTVNMRRRVKGGKLHQTELEY